MVFMFTSVSVNEKGNRLKSDAVPATVCLAKKLVVVIKLYPLFKLEWEGK